MPPEWARLRKKNLQRWYTTFPHGWPAIGLLLLRIAIGGRLILQGSTCLSSAQGLSLGASVPGLLALGAGISIALGLLTPFAACVSALAGAATYLWHPAWFPFPDLGFETTLTAIAIALLGPGAISFDAHLFGRRKIVIPRAARS